MEDVEGWRTRCDLRYGLGASRPGEVVLVLLRLRLRHHSVVSRPFRSERCSSAPSTRSQHKIIPTLPTTTREQRRAEVDLGDDEC